MKVKLEAMIATTEVPDDLRVGDTVRIEAVGVVFGVEDDLIDVTPVGSEPQTVPGQRTVSVLLELAAVDAVGAGESV